LGPKGEEVISDWSKLHNEQYYLMVIHYGDNTKHEMAGACSIERRVMQVHFGRKTLWKQTTRRLKYRYEVILNCVLDYLDGGK
jgi:hypothetical protein